MPNRKIKHIVAKLVGASTEETLDVYDVDAVHTADIANNLTTTNEGYVLDARQGKALNDSLTNLIIRRSYTCSYTVNANSATGLTGVQFGASTPSGYYPLCFGSISPSDTTNNIVLVRADCYAYSGVMLTVRNLTSNNISSSATVYVVYIKASVYDQS